MPAPTQVLPPPPMGFNNADRSVTLMRAFTAPRHVVWQGFTDPAVLAHWLPGPPGWALSHCKVSLVQGGGYLWRWQNPRTGEVFGFRGTYSVVEPEHRLIDKQVMDTGKDPMPRGEPIKNTALFEVEGQGCRVTTTIRYPDAATRDLVINGGLVGAMEAAYQRLDRMLLRAAA